MNSLEKAQKANFTEVEKTKETFNLNDFEVTALEESELSKTEGGCDACEIVLSSLVGGHWLYFVEELH